MDLSHINSPKQGKVDDTIDVASPSLDRLTPNDFELEHSGLAHVLPANSVSISIESIQRDLPDSDSNHHINHDEDVDSFLCALDGIVGGVDKTTSKDICSITNDDMSKPKPIPPSLAEAVCFGRSDLSPVRVNIGRSSDQTIELASLPPLNMSRGAEVSELDLRSQSVADIFSEPDRLKRSDTQLWSSFDSQSRSPVNLDISNIDQSFSPTAEMLFPSPPESHQVTPTRISKDRRSPAFFGKDSLIDKMLDENPNSIRSSIISKAVSCGAKPLKLYSWARRRRLSDSSETRVYYTIPQRAFALSLGVYGSATKPIDLDITPEEALCQKNEVECRLGQTSIDPIVLGSDDDCDNAPQHSKLAVECVSPCSSKSSETSSMANALSADCDALTTERRSVDSSERNNTVCHDSGHSLFISIPRASIRNETFSNDCDQPDNSYMDIDDEMSDIESLQTPSPKATPLSTHSRIILTKHDSPSVKIRSKLQSQETAQQVYILESESSTPPTLASIIGEGNQQLSKPKQLSAFGSFMMAQKTRRSRLAAIQILQNTTHLPVLTALMKSRAIQILTSWLSEAIRKKTDSDTLVVNILKLVQRLPIDIDALQYSGLGRPVKRIVKSASFANQMSETVTLADMLMTRWTMLIISNKHGRTMSPATKSAPTKRLIITVGAPSAKHIRVEPPPNEQSTKAQDSSDLDSPVCLPTLKLSAVCLQNSDLPPVIPATTPPSNSAPTTSSPECSLSVEYPPVVLNDPILQSPYNGADPFATGENIVVAGESQSSIIEPFRPISPVLDIDALFGPTTPEDLSQIAPADLNMHIPQIHNLDQFIGVADYNSATGGIQPVQPIPTLSTGQEAQLFEMMNEPSMPAVPTVPTDQSHRLEETINAAVYPTSIGAISLNSATGVELSKLHTPMSFKQKTKKNTYIRTAASASDLRPTMSTAELKRRISGDAISPFTSTISTPPTSSLALADSNSLTQFDTLPDMQFSMTNKQVKLPSFKKMPMLNPLGDMQFDPGFEIDMDLLLASLNNATAEELMSMGLDASAFPSGNGIGLMQPPPVTHNSVGKNRKPKSGSSKDLFKRKISGSVVVEEARISISDRTGLPKKTVQFLPDNILCNVYFFEVEDSNKPTTQNRVDSREFDKSECRYALQLLRNEQKAVLQWGAPRKMTLPDLFVRGRSSSEAKSQERREKAVSARVYLTPKDIPFSPEEPAAVSSTGGNGFEPIADSHVRIIPLFKAQKPPANTAVDHAIMQAVMAARVATAKSTPRDGMVFNGNSVATMHTPFQSPSHMQMDNSRAYPHYHPAASSNRFETHTRPPNIPLACVSDDPAPPRYGGSLLQKPPPINPYATFNTPLVSPFHINAMMNGRSNSQATPRNISFPYKPQGTFTPSPSPLIGVNMKTPPSTNKSLYCQKDRRSLPGEGASKFQNHHGKPPATFKTKSNPYLNSGGKGAAKNKFSMQHTSSRRLPPPPSHHNTTIRHRSLSPRKKRLPPVSSSNRSASKKGSHSRKHSRDSEQSPSLHRSGRRESSKNHSCDSSRDRRRYRDRSRGRSHSPSRSRSRSRSQSQSVTRRHQDRLRDDQNRPPPRQSRSSPSDDQPDSLPTKRTGASDVQVSPPATLSASSSRMACVLFQRGLCDLGRKCPHRHVIT
ncbi:hypothetical protein BASA60_004087 [Batrachochytrium salamandrivorans]|nr:hypothetical protein BASA60_004087 [Batrachochytrium salamandrivorans]